MPERFAHGEERVVNHFLGHYAQRTARLLEVGDDIVAADMRGARTGLRQPGQYGDQRGLAGAVGTQQAKEFAVFDVRLTSSRAWKPGLWGLEENLSAMVRGRGAYIFEICSRVRADMAIKKAWLEIKPSFDIIVGRIGAMRAIRESGAKSVWRDGHPACFPDRLLIALVQRGNQAIDAVLGDLLGKLIAVVLNQPDAFHVKVVDFPALGGFFQAIVDADRGPIALRKCGAHDQVVGVGVAAEGQHGERGLLGNAGKRAAICADERALERLDQGLLLLGRCLAPIASGSQARGFFQIDMRQYILVDDLIDLRRDCPL